MAVGRDTAPGLFRYPIRYPELRVVCLAMNSGMSIFKRKCFGRSAHVTRDDKISRAQDNIGSTSVL